MDPVLVVVVDGLVNSLDVSSALFSDTLSIIDELNGIGWAAF